METTFTTAEFAIAILATIAIVIGVIDLYVRLGDKPASEKVEEFQQERGVISTLEEAYAGSADGFRLVFDNATDGLEALSRFTVIKVDDSIAKVLRDIQEPGAPAKDTPTDEQPVFIDETPSA
ncbi:MAG: hypothetical protein AAF126_01485 [Chloroflexota bacterium]